MRAAGGWDRCLSGNSSIATETATTPSDYFNAGLLLLNLPAWRAARQPVDAALLRLGFRRPVASSAAAAPAAATAGQGPSSELLRYADQDALNLITCSTGWLPLDDKYNLQGIGTYLPDRTKPLPDQPALFSPEQAAALASAPAIVHFTGPPSISPAQLLNQFAAPPSKPWAPVCLNPFRAEWLACLDTTPWAGWRPQQEQLAAAAVDDLTALCRQLHGNAAAGSTTGAVGRLASHSSIAGGFDARGFLLQVSQLCLTAAEQCL